ASSQHLMGIINDILDFSKIEAGKMIIERIDFDLEDVLSNVSALINEKATEKGLELVFDVAADVPMTLMGDPLRLGQVLINFATNAVKFTDRGEITIGVRALEVNEHSTLLKFLVKDTGIGLSEEQMGRLFQSFQQADSSVTRKYGGTGLGLVICKNLARIMGGEIGVRSEVGQGSEFWFTARLGKSQIHHHRLQLTPHPDLRGKHMLVIDDNENARTVVSTLLQSMSFHVSEAISGPAALESIKQAVSQEKSFDAIFIDWQMPHMDGIEVAKNIRGMGLTPTPKLLLVTAYGREQVIKGAMQAGFDEIILKPINASSLYDAVARAFGKDTETDVPKLDKQNSEVSDLADLAGARILLVEDNEMNQQIASELLQDAGFFVDIAVNGQEGVDKVKQNMYQLVLMDMQMPVMDGLSATIEIRKSPHLATLPIIAMTANAMTQDRERCLAAGMNDHLPKPLEPNDLWAALRQWIKPGLVSGPIRTVEAIEAPSESTVPSALPSEIDGLNIKVALRRVQGKHHLYINMLHQFVDKQVSTPSDIQKALQKGDWETAERLAHTLKSLAGNIGAETLQESAEELETALRIQLSAPDIEKALENTSRLLDTLISNLNGKLSPVVQSAPQPATPEDATALAKLLTELYELLRDNDPEALNYFALHGHLLQTSQPERFSEIKQAIEGFQFEFALDQVAQLRHLLNIA
ncbi:MAG: hypothetical protein RL563_2410, partial [Pseudomonadota bacterium]